MEEERLKEALRQVIREKGRSRKNKKRPLKKVVAISGAIIITLTITIQSDSIKKNQTACTNELLNIKKISNVTKKKLYYGIEENYTTDLDLPDYLDEVYSTVAGPDFIDKNEKYRFSHALN